MATSNVEAGKQALRQRVRAIAGQKASNFARRKLAKAYPELYGELRQQYFNDNPFREPDFSRYTEETLEHIGQHHVEYKRRIYRRACAQRDALAHESV